MNARLVNYKNGMTELAFPIMGCGARIGREDDNEIQLPHEKVSKHHAALLPAEGGWLIKDLGSTNGVFVNGEQVPRATLKHGDRVRIGPYELFFETKGVGEEWVPSYLMDMSSKVHRPTIQQTKPPQKRQPGH